MENAIVPIMIFSIPIVYMVLKYLTRQRELQAQGLSDGAAAEILARAEKLDHRVQQLERILDAEAPGWRHRG